MFADFAPSTDFSTKSATIVVKDRHLLAGTRQNPDPRQNLTSVGSPLSQEERQLLDCG
jgi:hypothetical protein